MDLIFDDDHRNVTITWSKRTSLDAFLATSRHHLDTTDVFLYLISAYKCGQEKALYIGQSYSTSVRRRLKAQDHVQKRARWLRDRSLADHEIFVRLGVPIVADRNSAAISAALVNDVEAILIYAFDGEFCKNNKSVKNPAIKYKYEVRNENVPKYLLQRRIGFGFYAE